MNIYKEYIGVTSCIISNSSAKYYADNGLPVVMINDREALLIGFVPPATSENKIGYISSRKERNVDNIDIGLGYYLVIPSSRIYYDISTEKIKSTKSIDDYMTITYTNSEEAIKDNQIAVDLGIDVNVSHSDNKIILTFNSLLDLEKFKSQKEIIIKKQESSKKPNLNNKLILNQGEFDI